MHDPRVIVALDYDNKDTALAFVDKLDPSLCKLKVGKEMFTLFGPEFVKALIAKGFDVFLDLKFHDIPNTVAKACKAAAELGVLRDPLNELRDQVEVDAVGGQTVFGRLNDASWKTIEVIQWPRHTWRRVC